MRLPDLRLYYIIYSNGDSMVLAQKQKYRPMNRIGSPEKLMDYGHL